MKFRYRLLGQERRKLVRKEARKAYLRFQAIPGAPEDIVRDQLREKFSGWEVILLRIAISLAIALIRHWLEQRTYVPQEKFVAGEPGAPPF